MKRYKELKYNRKTYTEQWKIDEILLKEGFQWFLDCEVEDVRLEISHSTLIFNSGTFFNGTWKYGVFRDGVWKYGVWENGVWYNGKWFNGAFKDGIIFDGKFFHGRMEKGEIKGGEFYHMEISKEVKKEEKEPPKVIEPVDNKVPQGEKITTEKMKKYVKSFNDFLNEKKVVVTDIEYDTDGEEVDLPKTLEIEIPSHVEDDEIEDFISDEISNITGFCHKGFAIQGE